MLLIDNPTVERLLPMIECIDAQDRAFRGLPTGDSVHRPRIDLYMPAERPDGYYRWGTMEGASNELGVFAIRMKSDILHWPRDEHGFWKEEKYAVEPGTYCGLIFLFSTRNGEPLAIINDGILQHMRVGGGAGLGVRYLSRPDAQTVGMIGSGGMARTYLEGIRRGPRHPQRQGVQSDEGQPGALRRGDVREARDRGAHRRCAAGRRRRRRHRRRMYERDGAGAEGRVARTGPARDRRARANSTARCSSEQTSS